MFDYEEPSYTPVGLFLLQLFIAPFASLLLGAILTEVVDYFVAVGTVPKREAIVGYFTFSLTGFLVGYRIQTKIPAAVEAGGRWVWILPAAFSAYALFDELRRDLGPALASLFISDAFFTWPALVSCFYSIRIVAASRPPRASYEVSLRNFFRRF